MCWCLELVSVSANKPLTVSLLVVQSDALGTLRYQLTPRSPAAAQLNFGLCAPMQRAAQVGLSAVCSTAAFGSAPWDVSCNIQAPTAPQDAQCIFRRDDVELRVQFRLTLALARNAPLLQLCDRFAMRQRALHFVAPSFATSSSNDVPNTARITPPRYFCQPGSYSGDDWVAAAALLLDPQLQGFIVSYASDSVKDPELSVYVRKAAQALKFYGHCGVVDRVHELYLDKVRQHEALEHVEVCQKWLLSNPRAGDARDVKLVNVTTSVLMRAIEERGISVVLELLRARFTGGLDSTAQQAVQARLLPLMELLESGQRVVLLNMRIATYNVENIVTEAIYQQVLKAAALFGCRLVRVGIYQNDEGHQKYGAWTKSLGELALDVFGVEQQGVKSVDLRETACFWKGVYELQQHYRHLLGVIGPRSGSLDIAAFMGVRTLCFDTVNVADWEYIRLFMTFPLMSIAHRTGATQRPKRSSNLHDLHELREGVIEPQALHHWLAGGHPVPSHAGSPRLFLPQYRHILNARTTANYPQSEFSDYVVFMRPHVDWTHQPDASSVESAAKKDRQLAPPVVTQAQQPTPPAPAPVMPAAEPMDAQSSVQEELERIRSELECMTSPEEAMVRQQLLQRFHQLGGHHHF